MGRVKKVYKVNKSTRKVYEKQLTDKLRQGDGPVTQSAEDRTFNPDDGGSIPSGPTINKLVAKKCQHCSQAMHIHRKDEVVVFAGCEPCIIDIRLERVNQDQLLIKGSRSTHRARCCNCRRSHMLSSFEEVKDVDGTVSRTGEASQE